MGAELGILPTGKVQMASGKGEQGTEADTRVYCRLQDVASLMCDIKEMLIVMMVTLKIVKLTRLAACIDELRIAYAI